MARKQTESWAEHAQHVVAQSKHHTGAARQALLELLDTQACALSAIEIEDALRKRARPIGRASIYRILDELERRWESPSRRDARRLATGRSPWQAPATRSTIAPLRGRVEAGLRLATDAITPPAPASVVRGAARGTRTWTCCARGEHVLALWV